MTPPGQSRGVPIKNNFLWIKKKSSNAKTLHAHQLQVRQYAKLSWKTHLTEITREGVGVKPFKVMTQGCAAKQSKGAFIPGCFSFLLLVFVMLKLIKTLTYHPKFQMSY